MKLSEKIKSVRKNTGLTMEDFGKTIGCSRKMISHYEKGKFVMPISKMLKFSEVYGIETEEVMDMLDKMDEKIDFGENVKEIKGYDHEYFINIKGDIFRSYYISSDGKYIKTKKLEQSLGENGYYYVNLKRNGTKLEYVHRLIGKAYVPFVKGKEQINHKNGIKTDNNIENLEWVTLRENSRHSFENGFSKSGEKSAKSKLKLEQVLEIKESKKSDTELSKQYGISRAQAYRIKRGLNWGLAINIAQESERAEHKGNAEQDYAKAKKYYNWLEELE